MKKIAFSFLSSILLVLSFPPFSYGILAWVALVPLFTSIRREPFRVRCALSFFTAIIFFMGLFSWINVIEGFSPVDFLLLGIYLSSYIACFGAVGYGMVGLGKWIFPPCAAAVWVSLEYLRANAGFVALPWGLLGHSQYRYLPVIQIASWTGVYGISFLIALANLSLSEVVCVIFDKRRVREKVEFADLQHLLALFLLFGVFVACGYHLAAAETGPDTIRVTVVQGNVPQDLKWNQELRDKFFEKYLSLSEQAARGSGTSMVVWPETAIPRLAPADQHLLKSLREFSRHHNAFFLFGSALRPKFTKKDLGNPRRFNSAFLISPSGAFSGKYDKIRLLPFAEYLPGRDRFPWPERLDSSAGYYLPGKKRTLFDIDGTHFGVLICWENIFPDLFRLFVKDGAQFMVNMTNEAWFGETAAPEQFVMMSVFRAVENRVAVVRCANTGISCAIGPAGDLLGKVHRGGKDIFIEGYATLDVPIGEARRTFYTNHGDLFAAGCFAAVGLGLAMSILKVRREKMSGVHRGQA